MEIENCNNIGLEKISVDAIQISENDRKRSNFVNNLIHMNQQSLIKKSKSIRNIPKNIIQFWDDVNIPDDVKDCAETWEKLQSKGYHYTLFNNDSAKQFISERLLLDNVTAFDRCYHPAMKSDYFRLCFIYSTGGLYVDVDDVYNNGIDIDTLFVDEQLKLQPLCFNVNSDEMVDTEKFMKNRSFSNSWIYYFNNNPIISPPKNPIIGYALRRATSIILGYADNNLPEIQSTAGPGNLTASVVACLSNGNSNRQDQCFYILSEWDTYSRTIWPLSYRNDMRNWRLSNKKLYIPRKETNEKIDKDD